MTRKEVFAKYGIQYNGKQIFCDPINAWIPLMLIDGNDKIGKGVWHFSTFPGTHAPKANVIEKAFAIMGIDIDVENVSECKGTCSCDCAGCYGKEGRYKMDCTNAPLVMRTYLARVYPAWVENAITAQIEAFGIEMVRIHATGDFFSDEYVNMWVRIATAFTDKCIFWTYTKTAFQSLKVFDSLKNANIVKSYISGKGFNFGHAGYIVALYRDLVSMGKSVWICRCGIDKNQHCNTCHHCFTAEYVLFLEHSTDYKPELDPDYAEFIELVNGQIED